MMKQYVEPVVRDINQPDTALLRMSIVVWRDGRQEASYEFLYEHPTMERNAALLRHAAFLVQQHAGRVSRLDPPGSPG